MKRFTAVLLLAVVGCTSGGGPSGTEPRAEGHAARSSHGRPTSWKAAKISFFSTQTGGMAQQQGRPVPANPTFGVHRGPSYIALLSPKWGYRDFYEAVDQQAYDVAYGQAVGEREDLSLGEPFELVCKPNIKYPGDEVLARLFDLFEEKGFFDMPASAEAPISKDAAGRYFVPPGRAWMMVEIDEWRRSVALDDLRPEQASAFCEMTSALAGAFTAAAWPHATVVLDPVRVWDKRALEEMGKQCAQQRPDAEMTDKNARDARYYNSPKADDKWMEKKPDTDQTPLDDFFGKPHK